MLFSVLAKATDLMIKLSLSVIIYFHFSQHFTLKKKPIFFAEFSFPTLLEVKKWLVVGGS